MRHAIIKNGVVTNVVLWDGSAPFQVDGQVVDLADGAAAGIGWTYDGTAFHAPAATGPRNIAKVDFMRRLTTAQNARLNLVRKQVAALVAADYTDPNKQTLVQAEVLLNNRFDLIDVLDLNHPEMQQAAALFVALGVIAQADVPALLA